MIPYSSIPNIHGRKVCKSRSKYLVSNLQSNHVPNSGHGRGGGRRRKGKGKRKASLKCNCGEMLVGELPEDRRSVLGGGDGSAPELKSAQELTSEWETIALEQAKQNHVHSWKRQKRETSRVPQFRRRYFRRKASK